MLKLPKCSPNSQTIQTGEPHHFPSFDYDKPKDRNAENSNSDPKENEEGLHDDGFCYEVQTNQMI
jgi:hypothetical protein